MGALGTAAGLHPSRDRAEIEPHIRAATQASGRDNRNAWKAADFSRGLLWAETLEACEAGRLEQEVTAAPESVWDDGILYR